MPKTTNYNLEKPNDNSIADIAVINNNMDIVDTELFNKVDQEAGKGLSSNDFTDDEKAKVTSSVIHATQNSSDIMSLAVEVAILKNASLNNLTNNVFFENFDNLDSVTLDNGIYDPVQNKIYV